MLGSERRVVITGLGVVSSLGDRPDRLLGSLLDGRGAVGKLEAFPVAGLANDIGAEIRGFELKNYALPKYRKALAKSKKYMARDIQLAVAAAQLALDDAGLVDGGVEPTRIGIDLGAGIISSELDEIGPAIAHSYPNGRDFDFQIWGRESIGLIEPLWLLKYLPNMLACHISILFDCQGPSNSITESDASSNLAIVEAARVIARGGADVMVTGGADSKIHPLSFVRMCMLQKMSRWKGEPSEACKPFDRAPRRVGSRRGGRDLDPRGTRARPETRRTHPRRNPWWRFGMRCDACGSARSGRRRHRGRHHRSTCRRGPRAVAGRACQRSWVGRSSGRSG